MSLTKWGSCVPLLSLQCRFPRTPFFDWKYQADKRSSDRDDANVKSKVLYQHILVFSATALTATTVGLQKEDASLWNRYCESSTQASFVYRPTFIRSIIWKHHFNKSRPCKQGCDADSSECGPVWKVLKSSWSQLFGCEFFNSYGGGLGGWVEFCFQAKGQLTDAKKHSPINVIDELRDLIVSPRPLRALFTWARCALM
jgi:hypothetical protein